MIRTIDIFYNRDPQKQEIAAIKGLDHGTPLAVFLHKSASRNKANDINRKQRANGIKEHLRVQRILDVGPIDAHEHVDRQKDLENELIKIGNDRVVKLFLFAEPISNKHKKISGATAEKATIKFSMTTYPSLSRHESG